MVIHRIGLLRLDKGPLVALSWDQRQLLYVAARARGQDLSIVAAESVPLEAAEKRGQASEEDQPSVGSQIRSAMERNGIKRPKAIVAVSHSQLEMLQLTVPPATDDELPQLVRNEVVRQCPDVTADCAIDYWTIDDARETPRRVAVAILRADALAEIQRQCQTAGVRIVGITLRPLAAASLLDLTATSHRECLLLNLLDREVDLTALADGRAIFSRTVQVSQQDNHPGAVGQIASEIKRTLAAAPQDANDADDIQHIYTFGSDAGQQDFVELLAKETSLSISLLNPFDPFTPADGFTPDRTHLFAGLLGAIHDYVHGGAAVDFLSPKRPKAPPNHRRKIAVYAAAVAILAGLGYFHFSSVLASLDADRGKLSKKLKESQEQFQRALKKKAVVDAITSWHANDVSWLDELHDISQRLPAGRDLRVQQVTMSSIGQSGGVVDLQMRVRDPSIVPEMENRLRDTDRRVRSDGVSQSSTPTDYAWQLQTRLLLRPKSKDQYRQESE